MENYDPHFYIPKLNFFLNTITINFPNKPNDYMKKIYYDLLNNFHIYIPTVTLQKFYKNLLYNYPIKPYLDNKNDFEKWILLIINSFRIKINEKPFSYLENKQNYNEHYLPKKIYIHNKIKKYRKYLIFLIITVMLLVINKIYN